MKTTPILTYIDASMPGAPCKQRWERFSDGPLGAIIGVTQCIKGEWHPCSGGWYVSTLMASENPADRIALDFGAQWYASGLQAVLRACKEQGIQ